MAISERTRLERLPVSEDWLPVVWQGDGFCCRRCGGRARLHPRFDEIWGCLHCGQATTAITQTFRYRMYELESENNSAMQSESLDTA